MTTIAYKHPYIAYDGLSTAGSLIISEIENKKYSGSGCEHFISGAVCDAQDFADNVANKKVEDMLYECYSISADESGNVFKITQNEDGFFNKYPIQRETVLAIGSGADFAIAAMDLGKSAKEAVEYAATRDIYTGGTIKVFNVDTMEVEG